MLYFLNYKKATAAPQDWGCRGLKLYQSFFIIHLQEQHLLVQLPVELQVPEPVLTAAESVELRLVPELMVVGSVLMVPEKQVPETAQQQMDSA